MAQLRIPFRRIAVLTLLASIVPVAIFVVLGATQRLDWDIVILCAVILVLSLFVMVRFGLGDVYRVLRFSESLARDGAAVPPPGRMSGLFPEFSEAVTDLQQAWEQDRGQLDARASSAETMLENLPHPLILVDTERRIVRSTAGALDLLGDIEPGRDLSGIIRNPDLLTAADRVLSGEADDGVVEFDIPDRSFSAQIQPLGSTETNNAGAVIAFYDMTEIRQVDRMRSDFVANASHELRTPLAVLNGCIKTLMGPARDDTEGSEKFLHMMEQHAERMTSLIEDLLSLSRIELNENTPPEDVVDIGDIMSTVSGALETVAGRRGIGIEVEPGIGGQKALGDQVEITQRIRNHVDNASKYSDENSVVRMRTRESAGPGGKGESLFLEVSVQDEGAGIPAEHLPRLTERFYRVDTARSREMGGTGLGLAIVKHIVNRHRGTLVIESVEGEGSTFRVFLPLASTSAATA